MKYLRNTHLLARYVLIWFALSIGVAIASPMVNPRAMQLICAGTGSVKVVASNSDGTAPVASHTLDCPLCVGIGAPPPVAISEFSPIQVHAYALQSIASTHIASLAAAPLPARGPPQAHALPGL